jgi:hypothetical protein
MLNTYRHPEDPRDLEDLKDPEDPRDLEDPEVVVAEPTRNGKMERSVVKRRDAYELRT